MNIGMVKVIGLFHLLVRACFSYFVYVYSGRHFGAMSVRLASFAPNQTE